MALFCPPAYSLCCVVDWHIKNFLCYWDPKEEGLRSEKFVIDSLHQSSWFLSCYPKGQIDPNVHFYLHRSNDALEEEKIHVKFKISLMDCKDTCILEHGTRFYDFKVNRGNGYNMFITQEKILHEAEKYLPQDICRIRCEIFKLGLELTPVIKVFLNTHIPGKRFFFDWNIVNFPTGSNLFTIDSSRTIYVVSPFDRESILSFTVSYLPHEREKFLKINFSGNTDGSKFSWQCKMHISKTKEEILKIHDNLSSLPYKGLFQPNVSRDTMIHNAEHYLCVGSLVLSCEVVMILHKLTNTAITHLQSKNQVLSVEYLNENENTLLITHKSNTQSHGFLKNDIVRMYHKGIMSDFSVKVKGIEFPVHSFILASRSPVFCTMLETNMKEKQDKVLKLDDVDENVVHRFLDYLYTDDTRELTVDLALELYRLGHLYEIKGLKEDSANFLKQNINTLNIADIILLSDRHEDEGLKSEAVKFIFHNEEEVLLCKEYKDFATSNAQISVDIFFKLSEMRLKKAKK